MHLISLVLAFLDGFPHNIPLAILLCSIYFFVIFCGFSATMHTTKKYHRFSIFTPLLLILLWIYGELRAAGILSYGFDKEGFLYDTNYIVGSILVFFSSAALWGVVLAIIKYLKSL